MFFDLQVLIEVNPSFNWKKVKCLFWQLCPCQRSLWRRKKKYYQLSFRVKEIVIVADFLRARGRSKCFLSWSPRRNDMARWRTILFSWLFGNIFSFWCLLSSRDGEKGMERRLMEKSVCLLKRHYIFSYKRTAHLGWQIESRNSFELPPKE